MKRVISLSMVLMLLISFMLPTAYGAEEPTVGELQYVIREGTGTMKGVTELIHASEQYLIFRKAHSMGIMDMNGRILTEGPFAEIEFVVGDLFAVKRDGYFALYRGGKALTDYKYRKIEKGYSLVRGFCIDQVTVDRFDFNGEVASVPPVPKDTYQVYDYIPDRCIMLCYVGQISNGTTPHFYYVMATPEGKVLGNTSSYSPIEQVTDGLFRIEDWSYCYYNLKGERAFGDEVKGGQVFPAPDGSSFILHYEVDGRSYYRLYDRWANYLRDIEAVHLESAHNMVINYVNNQTLLCQKTATDYVITDLEGNVLQTLQGVLIPTSIRAEAPGQVSSTMNGTTELGFVMYSGGEMRFYRSDLSGSFAVPGNCRIYPEQKMIVSIHSDKSESLYTPDGQELCHGEGSGSALPAGSFYGVKKDGSVRICTLDGQVIADREYSSCKRSNNPHIIVASSRARGGDFLLNAQGKELNDKAFEEWNEGQSENVVYKRNGAYGIARIYTGQGNPFLDVPQGAWYQEGAEFCAEKGLFNGTEPGRFSPEKNMTRAMLVTVLWRLEGEPVAAGENPFTDVKEGTWYTSAVQWATAKGIVNGVGKGLFHPNGNVTREQIATILYRYATLKGRDTRTAGDLTTFPDVGQISNYAKDALAWMYGEGLINGVKSGNAVTLQPKGEATRAQVATILMRYITP